MFLDRMFSYNFSSMPLYFSEKLMNYPDIPPSVLSDKPVRDLCVTQQGGLRKLPLHVPEIGCYLVNLHLASSACSVIFKLQLANLKKLHTQVGVD